MPFYTGQHGSIEVDGVVIAKVQSWSFSSSLELKDVSKVGDCESSYEPGKRNSQGSAQIWYYDDAPKPLLAKLLNTGGAAGAFTMRLRWGPKRLTFPAIITSADVTCSVGEVMSAAIGFTVNGKLTEAVL
ncbi:MAG: hypothetical protein ACO23G_10740 [Limnohabitans sp.]